MKRLTVIGSGYVGLSTAVALTELSHSVIAVDIDPAKIDSLKRGISPIAEAGMNEGSARGMESGQLSFSTEILESVDGADVGGVVLALGDGPAFFLFGDRDGFLDSGDGDGGDLGAGEFGEEGFAGLALGGGVDGCVLAAFDGKDGSAEGDGDRVAIFDGGDCDGDGDGDGGCGDYDADVWFSA